MKLTSQRSSAPDAADEFSSVVRFGIAPTFRSILQSKRIRKIGFAGFERPGRGWTNIVPTELRYFDFVAEAFDCLRNDAKTFCRGGFFTGFAKQLHSQTDAKGRGVGSVDSISDGGTQFQSIQRVCGCRECTDTRQHDMGRRSDFAGVFGQIPLAAQPIKRGLEGANVGDARIDDLNHEAGLKVRVDVDVELKLWLELEFKLWLEPKPFGSVC